MALPALKKTAADTSRRRSIAATPKSGSKPTKNRSFDRNRGRRSIGPQHPPGDSGSRATRWAFRDCFARARGGFSVSSSIPGDAQLERRQDARGELALLFALAALPLAALFLACLFLAALLLRCHTDPPMVVG